MKVLENKGNDADFTKTVLRAWTVNLKILSRQQ